MRLNLVMECENAAFADDAGAEIARILRDLADNLESVAYGDVTHRLLRDTSGNMVGSADLDH